MESSATALEADAVLPWCYMLAGSSDKPVAMRSERAAPLQAAGSVRGFASKRVNVRGCRGRISPGIAGTPTATFTPLPYLFQLLLLPEHR